MSGMIENIYGRLAAAVALTLLSFLLSGPVRADLLSFEEVYRYDAGEADSKLSCRALSLLEVKKLLLERLGTYIESTSRVTDFQLSSDEVTTLSAGIVKTEILSEQWDGRTYTLIARLQADPEEVNRLVAEIAGRDRKRQELRQLEDLNREGQERISQLRAEMTAIQGDKERKQQELRQLEELNRDGQQRLDRLKEEMAAIQNDRDRKQEELAQLEKLNQDGLERLNQLKDQMVLIQNDMLTANQDYRQAARLLASWGAYEQGLKEMREKRFAEAVASFSLAVEGHPSADSYLWRSKAFRKAGDSRRALDDLEQALRLDPKIAEAYFLRGQILREGGEKKQGLAEIRKAASLGHGKARLWLKAKGK